MIKTRRKSESYRCLYSTVINALKEFNFLNLSLNPSLFEKQYNKLEIAYYLEVPM